MPICQRQHRQEREKEREERETRGAKEGATGGSCYQRRRDDAGAGVVVGMDWRGLQGESDEDRLSTASVPGWIPEMFDADSFINANLTAWKLQRTIKTSNVR